MPFWTLFSSTTNSFRNQLPEEQTILVVRKHWITLFWPMLFLLFFILLPFLVDSYLKSAPWFSAYESLYWFLTCAYFLALWNAFFGNLMIFSLNTLVVTNQRIIDNQQKGLFQHQLNEMKLDKIQDATVKINGVFANILNYGDLQIQSAGSQNEFYFTTIPSPEAVKKTISDLRG